MRLQTRTLCVAVGIGSSLACGEAAPHEAFTTTDSAGIRIVTNLEPPDTAPLRLVEDLSIGVVEGDEAYMFTAISAIAVTPADTIYVLDGDAFQIKVYDTSGKHVRTFGREGDGPGEFRSPSLLTLLGDTLVVYDWRARRLSCFTLGGTLLRTAQMEVPTFASGIAALDDSTIVLQTDAGYSMPPRPEREGKTWLLHVALDGRILDTLLVTAGVDQVPHRTESMLNVLPAPFPRGPRWDVAPPGRVVAYGRGETYEIGMYAYPPIRGDSIGTLRMLVRNTTPAGPVTDDDMAAYRSEWLDGDDVTPEQRRMYEATIAQATIPDTWQAFDRLRFDARARLWVRRPPRRADSLALWDVYHRNGRWIATYALPKSLRVRWITADAVYGNMRDELDVQYVKRSSIASIP